MDITDIVYCEYRLSHKHNKKIPFFNICFKETDADYSRKDVWIDKSQEKLCRKIFSLVRRNKDNFVWLKGGHTGSSYIVYINKDFLLDGKYFSIRRTNKEVVLYLRTETTPKDKHVIRGSGYSKIISVKDPESLFYSFKGDKETLDMLLASIMLREEVSGL